MPTAKDRNRMEVLKEYTREHGLSAGLEKAERDSDKIEHLTKCEARAELLRKAGYAALAVPFENRANYLRASGVTA